MFGEKGLKRVYLHTLEWNERAQRCFSKCGFNTVRPVRRMSHDFFLMEVLRADWLDNSKRILDARWSDREKSPAAKPTVPSPTEISGKGAV